MKNHLKLELHDVISGKNKVRHGAIIQAIASYLRNGVETGRKIKSSEQSRTQEEEKLRKYITEHNLWRADIDFSQYVSEGAEQKVYLKNTKYVFKLNDAIYYNSWKDYFHNLLLHNFFFGDTAYKLIGFTETSNVLYAIVQQSYVSITENTNLEKVKSFLNLNGFDNIRNNDYYNPSLGIILEDLHDENVLTNNNILYFIDTVFYVTEQFWKAE